MRLNFLSTLAKLDTEMARELGSRHQIRSIPTLALFYQGRELARQAGAMGLADIVKWTQQHLSQAGLKA